MTGKPTPDINWKKDGRQLYDGRRYRTSVMADGTVSLTIAAPTVEDSGDYTVEAKNEFGQDRKTTTMTVQGNCFRLSYCTIELTNNCADALIYLPVSTIINLQIVLDF